MAKHKKNKDQNEKANKARSPVLHLFFVVFFWYLSRSFIPKLPLSLRFIQGFWQLQLDY